MKQRPSSRELVLDQVDCCALVHAFIHNIPTVRMLIKLIPAEKLKLFSEILISTLRIDFAPSAEVAGVYVSLIKAELGRLAKEKLVFRCRHSVSQHTQVLESALGRLKSIHAPSLS